MCKFNYFYIHSDFCNIYHMKRLCNGCATVLFFTYFRV
nr:MAG TPA: hypothetical protein [Bacteriophage sp.]